MKPFLPLRYSVRIGSLIVLLHPAAASADTDTWVNPGGGAYTTGGNWSLGTPPGANDVAAFTLNSAYSVTFPASVTPNQMLVDNGQVSFDLGGNTATLSFPFVALAVGQTSGNAAGLTLGNGTLAARDITVGAGAGLNVVGGGNLLLHGSTYDNTLSVGNDATGAFTVTSGGRATVDELDVAVGGSEGPPTSGTVTVAGANSAVTVNEDLKVGDHRYGTGNVTVKQGATVGGNLLYVAYSEGSAAAMTVDGATADFHLVGVGSSSTGTLTIRNGATVNAVTNFIGPGVVEIGEYNGGNGTLTITGAGSTLTTTGDMTIAVTTVLNRGDHSTGAFQVIGGGPVIRIGGNLRMGADRPSLDFTIDPTGISPILVSGSASLAGGLDVELDGFTPSPGESFTLLTANGGIKGSLTLTGPDAPEFSIHKVGNSLNVVYTGLPEPSGLAVITPALAVLVGKRKRRVPGRRGRLGLNAAAC